MARHAAGGDEVHVLLLGRGVSSRGVDPQKSASQQERLYAGAHLASEKLGARNVVIHDFPDNAMDSVPRLDLAKVIEQAIEYLRPRIIYTHDAGDLNVDHVRVHEAVMIAARPVPGQPVRSIYCFEVPSSTGWRPGAGFTPNHFVDVSQTLHTKLAALACYEEEMRPWPHARSLTAVEHLARWRGATVGVPAAEAFVIGRQIVHADS